jgi:chorismate-pyruvate lyase
MSNEYTILVGKPEGKRPLGRHMRRREDNIRRDFREVGLKVVDLIRLNQERDHCRIF